MHLAAFPSVVLVLGWSQAVFSFVEPPTNVTLYCHNVHNVLKWSYKQLSPELRFRVDIGSTKSLDGYPNLIWVNSSAQLQADVSFLSDLENEYNLVVSAVIGQNESSTEEELSFSYFKDSQVDQKCHLDFPAVNVSTLSDDTVLLRFTHPSLVYRDKLQSKPKKRTRQKKSNVVPGFHYEVKIIHQKERLHRFYCDTNVCEEKLKVDAAQKKHCLKMKGELEKVLVQATQEYCVLPREEAATYLIAVYVVCSVLALSVLLLIVYMVFRKGTTPNTAVPKSMIFSKTLKQVMSGSVQEPCSVPEVEPTSPTPLLTTDENEFAPFFTPSSEPELRLPIGVSTEDEGVCDDVEVAIDEEPGYMEGRHLEEDDEVPTGYEKRPVLDKLAPDELTEGYRG